MAEKDDVMSALRDEALPLADALKKFSEGTTAVAMSMMANGIWSPEKFIQVTTGAARGAAPKIDALFNELKEN